MDSMWFFRFGEYISFWPGVVVLLIAYVGGLVAAFSHYRSWAKRGLYLIALTVSMVVLFNVLELVVLY